MTAQPIQNTSEEQLLGEIETQIVGLQYHAAGFEPGEAIHLEREPDNVHDGQAARLNGTPMKSLGGAVKAQVKQIKNLARSFGDDAFQRDIERAFQSERATVEKRRAAVRGDRG